MRLSGFSSQNLTTPHNRNPGNEGVSTPLQGASTRLAGNGFSVVSRLPLSGDGSSLATGKKTDSEAGTALPSQSNPSIDSLLQQIMSLITGSLSGGGTSASSTSDSSAEENPLFSRQDGQMSFAQATTTLGRHEDLLKKPLDREGLEKLRDDPQTPSDAKQALSTILDNPEMYAALDQAKNGKSDGKISAKDIQTVQQNPQIRRYADAKAEDYTHNYVPSDAEPGSASREMSANDAMRELYLYSESLPKNISQETLQKIADGSQDMGKCPPQVAAAAKFFTDHPDQWQQLTRKDDPSASVSRDRLCDLASYNVALSPQEHNALETVKNNEDIFFKGGGIKKDKLVDIANDSSNSQEVRDAANLLSQPNSMLFSMLDNGKHGAGGNFFNEANDKNISKGDVDAFIRKGNSAIATPDKLSRPSLNPADLSAQQEMAEGQETQPDEKKKKGGGFKKLLEALSYVVSGLTILIPGVGAAGLAATAGRAAATAAIKEGVKAGVKEGAKDAAKEGVKNALHDGQNGSGDASELNSPRVWAQS